MARNLIICGSTIIFLLISIALFASPVFAEQENAQTAIESAKNTIKGCYDGVKEAEAVGANVTSLMVTLNSAAGLLSQAELAYASNDYNAAHNYATQSQSTLDGFTSQAAILKQNALNSQTENLTLIIFSVIGSVALLCVGIGAWISLNRKERKRLHGDSAI